jgi:cell division protein FtsL
MIRRWLPPHVAIWVVPAVVALAIGTVWLRLSIVRTTYAINQAERRLAALRLEKEQMELKVAGLRSPRRLEILARTKFGLAQPRAEQVVHLK